MQPAAGLIAPGKRAPRSMRKAAAPSWRSRVSKMVSWAIVDRERAASSAASCAASTSPLQGDSRRDRSGRSPRRGNGLRRAKSHLSHRGSRYPSRGLARIMTSSGAVRRLATRQLLSASRGLAHCCGCLRFRSPAGEKRLQCNEARHLSRAMGRACARQIGCKRIIASRCRLASAISRS
jgi:hypothetical protein